MRNALITPARAIAAAAAVLAGLAVPAVAAAAGTGTHGAATQATTASAAAKVPRYNHIVVIMFTNHAYVDIRHNRYAPTFNRLARQYGLATRYYTTSDPDTAGTMALLAGNSFGIDDHAPYWDAA